MQGKFIIIEGTDGSGKTTQLKLLKKYLKEQGIKVKTLDFPQYDSYWGKLVGRFLSGEFGELDDVSPYLVSPYYYLDQASRSEDIKKWLEEGVYVLSNRYLGSSMAHQTCKFETEEEQDKYLSWLREGAYEKAGLVKEDLTLVLYADPKINKKLASEARGRKTNYTDGKDIAEDHETHVQDSAEMYKKLCKKYENWELLNCMDGKNIDSIENVNKKIIELINSKLK